ncbi:MAG: TRAP transporter small permease [Planctomycetes bacterium]|nr:TRAP transporter small permease [Planctomycetota bacterium]
MKSKLWAGVCNIDLFFSIVSLVILVTVTFFGVFMRYLFNNPFVWLDEVQMILIVWLTCFGAAAAMRKGGHIAIDMVVELLPKKMRQHLSLLILLVVILILSFLTWNSFGLVRQQYNFRRVTDILELPRACIFAALPVSSAMMTISFTILALRNYFAPDSGLPRREGGR